MQTCSACGRDNPDGFFHCGYCTAPLADRESERRRLATLVFCDLVGSTALGERVDPEAMRELLALYFGEMRAALERHGGSVEKFIGDAVLGAFGVRVAREDDALRACRAALEMQARLVVLNEELEQRFGIAVAVRVGVNTGEVVGSRETFVTGDAVNVAARLEQAAGPGEVFLGEATWRLVRGAVRVEPVVPLAVKGKSDLLTVYRLLEVSAFGPVPRREGTPLVGRQAELELLEHTFEEAVLRGSCRLVTVVGEAGVGKSRLAAELLGRVGQRARVVRGACLSYGEGITFWAIGEIVRELAGIRDEHSLAEARSLLDRVQDDPVVAARIAQLLGLAEGTATADQTAAAIARFLTAGAGGQPLVLLVDDIHWAEPTLLDLLASLPAMVDGTALMLVCLARSELLEHRPEWPVSVRLSPLANADVAVLLDNLVAGAPPEVRSRLAAIAAGNPLFAEELVAMLIDEGVLLRRADGSWLLERELAEVELPASLNSLLAARLDRLDADARNALERGAVEGELFHRGAVVELSEPEARPTVSAGLERLSGKDMIRPTAASFAGELAFRFKHILVREATYRATAKKLRASLHEHFANWLERLAGDRVGEHQEILGYHLEQAHRYRAELALVDDETRSLAARAGRHLGAAGHRAVDRGDVHAATNLLGRASALLPADSLERLELLLPYGYAVGETGRVLEGRTIFNELHERATAIGERRLAARARIGPLGIVDTAADKWAVAQELAETFTELGDETGLAQAYRALGLDCRARGQMVESAAWLERALFHANGCGDLVTRRTVTQGLSMAQCWGPVPVSEATARCEELREANRDDRVLDAVLARHLSSLYAMAGRFDHAREAWEEGGRVLEEANMVVTSWVSAMHSAVARDLAGDRNGAEADLKAMWSHTRDVEGGDPDSRAMHAAYRLAYLYCDEGRWADAEECLAFHRDFDFPNVEAVAVYRHAALARLKAHRGELTEAATLAQRAVDVAEATDMSNVRANTWLAMAEVLQAGGQAAEARAAVARALELFEQKGNVAAAGRLTARAT